ncbi:MAG: hypothetical protein ACXVZJ_03915 [Terriglobales bacterium]
MPIVKLKIDVGGTIGHEAWFGIHQFPENQGAFFGPEFGSSGECKHPANIPHPKGEWIGAEVMVATSLLAQYAMSHYLEQDRVLDVDIEE